ncbi:hypothetical protein U1Q18_033138, partial [Sarracenia purpurea var. burkii]
DDPTRLHHSTYSNHHPYFHDPICQPELQAQPANQTKPNGNKQAQPANQTKPLPDTPWPITQSIQSFQLRGSQSEPADPSLHLAPVAYGLSMKSGDEASQTKQDVIIGIE